MRYRSLNPTERVPIARPTLEAILNVLGSRADTPSRAWVSQSLATVPIAKRQFIGDYYWHEFNQRRGNP